MNTVGRSIACCIAGLPLVLFGAAAWSQTIGSVVQLKGTLSAQRADKTTRILLPKSAVLLGDTLTTQKDTFGQINFTDGSSVMLRPNTTMRIEQYQFDHNRPQADGLAMRLLRGGMRSVTGLIGRRGNKDAYEIRTSIATIGIRGSSGETMDCMQGCEGTTSKSAGLARGVYHATLTDTYVMTTKGGSVTLTAGQFGFSNDPNKPPVRLPKDPGLALDPFPFALGPENPVQECVVE